MIFIFCLIVGYDIAHVKWFRTGRACCVSCNKLRFNDRSTHLHARLIHTLSEFTIHIYYYYYYYS